MNCCEKLSADKESYIPFSSSDSMLLKFLIIKIELQILLSAGADSVLTKLVVITNVVFNNQQHKIKIKLICVK